VPGPQPRPVQTVAVCIDEMMAASRGNVAAAESWRMGAITRNR
jgi:hypothetical protein